MRLTVLLLLCIPLFSLAQSPSYNFGFEQLDPATGKPAGWDLGSFSGAGGRPATIDSVRPYAGRYALLIARDTSAGPSGFDACSYVIPAKFTGKKIVLQGYIRTENVKDGWAGLWMRIDGAGQFDNMHNRPIKGTTDWQAYRIELKLGPEASSIVFGGLLSGTGKMWLDNLSLTIDGQDIAVAPRIDSAALAPQPAQLQWLKAQAMPLKTVDAGNGTEDLQGLKALIGNARIVSLGECTHGTSEIFRMKHRLLEFLVKEMDFSIFSIEANMPETNGINDYVLYGKGDPKKLLDTMYFWTWHTQEVLDMITWMRRYNMEHPAKPVQFTGFDMQYYQGAVSNLQRFAAQYAPALRPLADSIGLRCRLLWQQLRISTPDARPLKQHLHNCRQQLEAQRKTYAQQAGDSLLAWTLQNVTILEQYAALASAGRNGFGVRDRSMADNVAWLAEQHPHSKIVLWAHNGHINRGMPTFMGGYLHKKFGKDMIVLGFAAANGAYTAVTPGKGVGSRNVLSPPALRSFESYAQASGAGNFILDIRKEKLNDPRAAWLRGSLKIRSIGAIAMGPQQQFTQCVLPDQYDAIIYLEQTKASACFRSSP